jgi:hypothetical protein
MGDAELRGGATPAKIAATRGYGAEVNRIDPAAEHNKISSWGFHPAYVAPFRIGGDPR